VGVDVVVLAQDGCNQEVLARCALGVGVERVVSADPEREVAGHVHVGDGELHGVARQLS
jgi:hypothetical protein